jgi:hypothetical protein
MGLRSLASRVVDRSAKRLRDHPQLGRDRVYWGPALSQSFGSMHPAQFQADLHVKLSHGASPFIGAVQSSRRASVTTGTASGHH